MPPRHQPPPLLGLLLRLLNQHWGQQVHEALHEAGFDGIGAANANVIPFVPEEGIQVSELAKLARVRKQSMAQSVEQLEQLGYLERRPDPNDRRARLVFLTDRGKAVRPVAVKAGREVEKQWAQLTSQEEVESLRASLQELLGKLRDEPQEPSVA
jgi:DNA-binding MarR family transcriptional regulator